MGRTLRQGEGTPTHKNLLQQTQGEIPGANAGPAKAMAEGVVAATVAVAAVAEDAAAGGKTEEREGASLA